MKFKLPNLTSGIRGLIGLVSCGHRMRAVDPKRSSSWLVLTWIVNNTNGFEPLRHFLHFALLHGP